MLMQAAIPVDSAGHRVDWVALPKAREAAECSSSLPRGHQVRIVLQCRSAAKDRVEACVVSNTTGATEPRFDKIAICTAEKAFRIRVTDPKGKVVTGTAVDVPVQLIGPR